MEERVVELLVEKIEYLEKALGARATYEIYEPVIFNSRDIVEIQKVVKQMAEFIGLSNYTFIVSKVRLDHDVGARIELNDASKEVFVELSNDIVNSCETVLAALAHELSHKYIQLNLSVPSKWRNYKYENEVLTDITAFFIGFGKLILNGCYEELHNSITYNGKTEDHISTTRMGYLTQEQYAFVYSLICRMRNIDPVTMRRGIHSQSLFFVERVMKLNEFGYLGKGYHDENYLSSFVDNVASTNDKIQTLSEEVSKRMESIITLIGQDAIQMNEESSRIVQAQLALLEKMESADIYDPALKYLNRVTHGNKAFENRELLRQRIDMLKAYRDKLNLIIAIYTEDVEVKSKNTNDGETVAKHQMNIFRKIFDKRKGEI